MTNPESTDLNLTPMHELDASGLRCPEPVMRLHAEVRLLAPASQLRVIATDPSTQRDIPRFCQFLGHTLLQQTAHDGHFEFIIQTKPDIGAT